MRKNISETLGDGSCATFLFLPNFNVICYLLVMMTKMMMKEIVKGNNDDDNVIDDNDSDYTDGYDTDDDEMIM